MYKLTSKLIIYRNLGEDSILFRLSDICRRFDEGDFDAEVLAQEVLDEIHKLLTSPPPTGSTTISGITI